MRLETETKLSPKIKKRVNPHSTLLSGQSVSVRISWMGQDFYLFCWVIGQESGFSKPAFVSLSTLALVQDVFPSHETSQLVMAMGRIW